MLDFVSILYFLIYIVSGINISKFVFRNEPILIRYWFGGVFGLLMLLWLPAVFSFLFSFSLLSQICAAVVCCAVGALFYSRNRSQATASASKTKLPYDMILTLLPLFLIGLILFSTHTIQHHSDGLYVGQSTYGDLSMHLGFITSISEQKSFPPNYSICPDTRIGYPFLSDSISSTFYTLGATLRFSTLLPALFAYLLVLCGVYFFFDQWMNSDRSKTVFATLLFFVGGGFGFAYFFDLLQENPGNFSRIFEAFYQTPTNYVTSGIKWVNPIADMLVPQRATLFGWALLFPCLYLLNRGAFYKEAQFFIPLGIIAGSMPLVHTHSFLALGVISAVYLFEELVHDRHRKTLTGFIRYAALTAVFAAPQLIFFTFRQSGHFLQFHFNWANTTDNCIWFYIKNLGLLFVLLPVAIIDNNSINRRILAGPGVLWLLAEFIQFQPNPYDNNKLLFVSFAFLCGLIADYLVRVYRRIRTNEIASVHGTRILAGIVCFSLFLSGTLTLIREYVSEYRLFDNYELEASRFIIDNTRADSTFLTANNHNNTVAVLTGRNIVCGSGSYLYYHGIDYYERESSLRQLYENPEDCFNALSEKYGIDYIYLGNSEYYSFDIDIEFFESNYKKIFCNETVSIYDVNQAPEEIDIPVS